MTKPAYVNKLEELGFKAVKVTRDTPVIWIYDLKTRKNVAMYDDSLLLHEVVYSLKSHPYVTTRAGENPHGDFLTIPKNEERWDVSYGDVHLALIRGVHGKKPRI